MKNKNVRGIIALALVTALSFGVIAGSRKLSHNIVTDVETNVTEESVEVLEELDTADAENIERAVKTENGYKVTVKTKGYGGEIRMDVSFDADAKNVTKVEVLELSETDGVGSKIAEDEFLSQFNGVAAPVYLPGMSAEDVAAAEKEEAATEAQTDTEAQTEAAPAELNDGTYVATTPEADANGFIGEVTMTVADGKITEVIWENYDAEGNKKSVLSETGEYVMTEDGPTWKEQAESLGAALVASQSIAGLEMNEEGKTDAVSGVSINIMGFAALAEECLAQAAGEASPVELNDGTYVATTPEADGNGFIGEVTMTVADGKITEVIWENYDAEGNKKSVLSETGEYVMTEDGPTWKEQAESLGAALVASQSIAGLEMNEEGKTDAVSGVSINIMGFAALAEECLAQAAGEEAATDAEAATEASETEAAAPADGTLVDAVSGATISSTAAVKGINAAYSFLQTAK